MGDNKIPTAEEFLLNYEQEYFQGAVYGEFAYSSKEATKAMVAFAQAHVKAALKAAYTAVDACSTPSDYGYDVFILNSEVIEGAYPEDNIK